MLFGRILCSLAVVTITLACSEEEAPRGAEGASPSQIEAEVRQRCSDFAARLCASAADCCESTGAAFSAESCARSFIEEFCGPASQVVAAGDATYHPLDEEQCLAAWAEAHATCVADWDQILEIRRDVWSACKMVRGTYAVGSGCSTSSQCAQPDGPATARCLPDRSGTTCQVLEMLAEGAECRFPMGDVPMCNTGLYCTTTERDGMGACAPVVPEGEPCDVSENSECGLGSYCGLDDGVCHRATNFGGPSCTQGAECVSFQCDDSSTGGACEDAVVTAADLCARGAESE